MHIFKDNDGRAWQVNINVNAVRRCRGLLGVDLYGLVDAKFEGLDRLCNDPVALIDVLYVLVKEDAEARGISDEDFGRAFAGDALEAGADAFVEELADFFPNPRVRAGLKAVLEKARQVRGKMMDHLDKLMQLIDPEAEAAKLIASSGTSPASSGSTPAPSPSASST